MCNSICYIARAFSYEVSTDVNSVKNQGPDLLKPVSRSESGKTPALKKESASQKRAKKEGEPATRKSMRMSKNPVKKEEDESSNEADKEKERNFVAEQRELGSKLKSVKLFTTVPCISTC